MIETDSHFNNQVRTAINRLLNGYYYSFNKGEMPIQALHEAHLNAAIKKFKRNPGSANAVSLPFLLREQARREALREKAKLEWRVIFDDSTVRIERDGLSRYRVFVCGHPYSFKDFLRTYKSSIRVTAKAYMQIFELDKVNAQDGNR